MNFLFIWKAIWRKILWNTVSNWNNSSFNIKDLSSIHNYLITPEVYSPLGVITIWVTQQGSQVCKSLFPKCYHSITPPPQEGTECVWVKRSLISHTFKLTVILNWTVRQNWKDSSNGSLRNFKLLINERKYICQPCIKILYL